MVKMVGTEPPAVRIFDPYQEACERNIEVGFLPIHSADTLWIPAKRAIVVTSLAEDEATRRDLLTHSLGHVLTEGSPLHRGHQLGLIDDHLYEQSIRRRMARYSISLAALDLALACSRYADEVAEALSVSVHVLATRVRAMTCAERRAIGARVKRLLWPTGPAVTAPRIQCGAVAARQSMADRVCVATGLIATACAFGMVDWLVF
ncbi:Uncharacterised protein [Mycobacteroides abscessus subsp. abscessus]|nr:Uncharacterised protein [Mycobacteroides abscessus subsp. abscessus]